tara:strand:+ start:165 stop:563 length:399 start_codon:yes stop_codon:yes gene_type:complete
MSTKEKMNKLENKQQEIIDNRTEEPRKVLSEEEVHTNTDLWIPINPSNELQNLLIEYVGQKHNPENGEVNINMIAETLATDFPEFAFAYAEENFLRGYQLGLEDGENMAEVKRAGAAFDFKMAQQQKANAKK